MSNLFLDISSSCTGFVLAKNGSILEIGVLWFPKDIDIVDKCTYLKDWTSKMLRDNGVENLIYERYSFNMKMPNGSLACPQLQGAVFSTCYGVNVTDITPQTWRKQCGLKKKKTENWKVVVEDYFRGLYTIPERIESNITGNMRKTPSDYFDALGICVGWHNLKGLKVKYK